MCWSIPWRPWATLSSAALLHSTHLPRPNIQIATLPALTLLNPRNVAICSAHWVMRARLFTAHLAATRHSHRCSLSTSLLDFAPLCRVVHSTQRSVDPANNYEATAPPQPGSADRIPRVPLHRHIHIYICMYMYLFVSFSLYPTVKNSPSRQAASSACTRCPGTYIFESFFRGYIQQPLEIFSEYATSSTFLYPLPDKSYIGI